MHAIRNLLLGLMLTASLARADSSAPEYSLKATGSIEIGPDGAVRDIELDNGLPKAVRSLVEQSVPTWRFEPIQVDGRAVIARTRMTLNLDAFPLENELYRIQMSSAYFGTPEKRGNIFPPKYPLDAIRAGVGARVLLHAKLDAQGNVTDVHPYQTSLSKRGRARAEKRFRERFEAVSINAVKQWKFDPAERVDGATTGSTVTIPIEFVITANNDRSITNRWLRFIPGPINPAPWVDADSVAAQSTDGLSDGTAAALDSRFKLLSDVVGKAL